jgi:hypothetical protein
MAADEEREALRRLEERLDQASETAQRLMAEAAQAAVRGRAAEQEPALDEEPGRPPPSGWQSSENGRASTAGAELDALIGAARSLRELVPPEVIQRLAEAVKDVLLALRGLIDWYIERLERRRTEPPSVEDIPIE